MIKLDTERIQRVTKIANAAAQAVVDVHAKLVAAGIDAEYVSLTYAFTIEVLVTAEHGPEYVCGVAGEIENALGIKLELNKSMLKNVGFVEYSGRLDNGVYINVESSTRACKPLGKQTYTEERVVYAC